MHYARRLAVVVLLLCLATDERSTWAMGGGAPTSLHEILAQADVVAIANVITSSRDPGGTQGNCTLEIERVIHGEIANKRILVVNDDPNACLGPPATYTVGDRVLVCLVHQAKTRYSTCGLSHGVRVLGNNTNVDRMPRIQEFYRIRGVRDDAIRIRHWAEWAVRCAERPSTRRDGLTLLSRGTHGQLDSKPLPSEPDRYYPVLDATQQQRLLDTLKQLPGDQDGRQDATGIMRVIAFSLHDQSLFQIANATTKLVQSGDAKNPSRAFLSKFDSLSRDFLTRYSRVQVRGTQGLSP